MPMKKLILLSFAFITTKVFACSVLSTAFCTEATHYKLVIKGKIINSVSHGIRIQVLHVLKGIEPRDTITIWDGTDFDCNGLVSMAASGMGITGDTILTMLPQIDSIANNWDVIGDYRRPYNFGPTTELKIINDTIVGFIAESAI